MSEEWTSAGTLTGRALGGFVRIVGDTHKAVAQRTEAAVPAVAKPYHDRHLAAAETAYQLIESVSVQAPRTLSRLGDRSAVDPRQTRVGRVLQPVINGFHGDLLAEQHPQLSLPMTLRVQGRDADPATDFRDATPHLVVFVHGLAEDETAWRRRGDQSYGERLTDLDLTPVYVRYNSGLHISDNGQDLSDLLDHLVSHWPVPVASISLVGHSMGGLVARSACHVGREWTPLVSAVVTLGTPHRGAPLEKAVHVLDVAMRRLPETEPIGRVLANRSAGVKDLRFGSMLEQDWRGHDVDEFLANRCAEVPFLPHVTYYWVAATLTRDPDHPMGRLMGDGMVRYPSASAVEGEGLRLGGVGHLDLLTDATVGEALRVWLQPKRDEG
jgi:pimeloyl-ACP methyl ester carboxylesterase